MKPASASPPLPGTEPGAGTPPFKKIWRVLAIFIVVSTILAAVRTVVSEPSVSFGQGDIGVEVVSGQFDLTNGLGGREALAPDHGMLFIFDQDGYQPIWMKDMKFNIDIVWLDKDYKVVTVEEDISPNTYPDAFMASELSRYVLEVSAGTADDHDIQVGDQANFYQVGSE